VKPVPVPDVWRALLAGAALILAGTAILHSVDYAGLQIALAEWGEGERYRVEVASLWWLFTVQLLALAGTLGWVAFGRSAGGDGLLALATALLVADAALLGAAQGLASPRSLLTTVCAGLALLARPLKKRATPKDVAS
jgi:hypothetical protein